jgi:transcriptional regulator with XRE-family HTH domain
MSLAANIRSRRVFLNWSQKELANRAGVSQQLINALEAERVRSTKFIREIAQALSCNVSELDGSYGGMSEEGPGLVNAPARSADLPIYGAIETEPGQAYISNEAIDFIERPEPLLNVRGGYGVIISSDVMSPEFEVGDYALINPHLPPVPGTTCFFSSIKQQQSISCIRRLQSIGSDLWTVKAWQSVGGVGIVTDLSREDWPKCHRIVGRFYRR